ncbi:MAG: hypothetical protein US18_C0006G0015 [Parcubacteria group bacterium GW2011_GWB1_36_5]|nr:MAG: hypothetical protein US18_C0006G0015 [Parcubacteria group bacterium GW2011_GWB1_36_5]
MRKRYKQKKRSCVLCKPNKMGLAKRWNNKELEGIKEFERERMYYA